jgi:hypothetical protein
MNIGEGKRKDRIEERWEGIEEKEREERNRGRKGREEGEEKSIV